MNSTLYHGDCLDYMRTMPDGCVDLIVTDPPYEIETHGAGLMSRRFYQGQVAPMSDGFSEDVLSEVVRVMKRVNLYTFCSKAQMPKLIDYFQSHVPGGANYTLITWHKSNPIPACGNKYLSDTEYCLFFRGHSVPVYGRFETKRTYYVTPLNKADKKLYGHPTVKPLEIIRNLIINSSQPGETVFDPFMGSGTTGAACSELGRKFIGCEINETYFNTARARIEAAEKQERLMEEDETE